MKRIFTSIAIIIALGFVASCNLIEDMSSESGLIRFLPKSVATKAMVSSVEDLIAAEATFSVVDLLDGETYIQNSIGYSTTDSKWVYLGTTDTYYWLDGTHKFFGYSKFGENEIGTLGNDWKLTIPASGTTTLTTSSEQNDILYSDIVSTTADDWKTNNEIDAPVGLKFHHLLSAVSFTLENYTGTDLTVNSVTVNLRNKANATVDFSGTAPDVEILNLAKDGPFGGISGKPLAAEARLDALTGDALTKDSETGEYPSGTPFMIWPQKIKEVDATVTVKYTIGTTTTEKTVSLVIDPEEEEDFEGVEWAPGVINNYNLRIFPETVTLVFKVQPWDKKTINVDTDLGSINMSNVTWMNFKVMVDGVEMNTLNNGAKTVTMYSGETEHTDYHGYYPAQGYFTVNYPKEGKYKIGLIPAYIDTNGQYFDEDAYEIWIYDSGTDTWHVHDQTDGEDISVETVYFQVRAADGQDGTQHMAQINIWFLPDGSDSEWISAYSEVRATYSLIIPAN